MAFLGYLLHLLARTLEACANGCQRLADLLYGLLPALLPPARLAVLARQHYDTVFRSLPQADLESYEHRLEIGEEEVLDRYHPRSSRMIVLGSGWGREAIAIARRGTEVLGLEMNPDAVRTAARTAGLAGVQARFLRADYLEPPIKPGCFNAVLLSSCMYSAIPGRSRRQAWLGMMQRLLRPPGVIILGFMREDGAGSRLRRLYRRLNGALARLPGANESYQPGDIWLYHFYHRFQDEKEIRTELGEAGVTVLHLDWARGYAAVAGFGFTSSGS